jgi:hypothetical protein
MHFSARQSKATKSPSHDEASRSLTRPVLSQHPLNHPLFKLQQTVGNRGVQRLVHSQPVQGLRPSQGGLLQRKCACGGTPGLDGECAECRQNRLSRQRHPTSQPEAAAVPPIVHEVLHSPGQPLDPAARASMESGFGHDFGRVRVHTDAKAAESAQAVDALAYTVGQDVVFGARQYAPETPAGRRLLAHELTHAVQQSPATQDAQGKLEVANPTDTAERDAEMASRTIAQAGQFVVKSKEARRIARQGAPDAGVAAPASYTFSVTTSGCDDLPYVRAMVVAAARAAFDKVLNSNCVHSESLKDEILSEFDGLNIDCEQGDDSDPCGMAWRYFTQTVNIYPKALNPSRCGALESTILHEVVHLTEWRPFGHGELADACEASCFGYGSGDPTKCK